MFSKVYSITWNPAKTDELLSYYDRVVAPAIRKSEFHVSHQAVAVGPAEWILISNYKSAQSAEAASGLVKEIVAPMIADYGMQMRVVGEGDTVREVS